MKLINTATEFFKIFFSLPGFFVLGYFVLSFFLTKTLGGNPTFSFLPIVTLIAIFFLLIGFTFRESNKKKTKF